MKALSNLELWALARTGSFYTLSYPWAGGIIRGELVSKRDLRSRLAGLHRTGTRLVAIELLKHPAGKSPVP